MSQKSEIKVYLPTKLVGELESRKKAGVRSKFIKNAIREKLDRREKSSPYDFELVHLLCTCRDMLFELNSEFKAKLLQSIIDEVNQG